MKGVACCCIFKEQKWHKMQEFCCLFVFLCQYIHSFICLRWQEGGAKAPLATPLNPPLSILTSFKMQTDIHGYVAMHGSCMVMTALGSGYVGHGLF